MMGKKYHKRLQGPEWYSLKDKLKMYKYTINENGHIKGFYKDEDSNLYSHWLSNKELEDFNRVHRPKATTLTFKIQTSGSTIDKIKDLRNYIDTKIQKSFDVDFGRSDTRADRLMTETIIELQLVIEKLDNILWDEFKKERGDK